MLPNVKTAPPADEVNRLRKLYELSMTLSGDPIEIFKHIARMIGELLDVKVVCLSQVRGEELYFLSVSVNGEVFLDAGQCPISITPCATVESSKDFRVYDRVSERFPAASFLKEHNAYSYCGFPALDNSGKVVAVTCLLDDRPHDFSEDDHNILRIFGQRIGLEIERQRFLDEKNKAQEELRRHHDKLEEMVEERTAKIQSMQEELIRKERLATLGQLTGMVSHELRNPLGTILSSVYAISEKITDPNLAKPLERIQRGINRCNNIVSDLLNFARDRKLELKELDLDSWLTETLKEFTLPPEVQVITQLESRTRLRLDPELLRRAMLNVFDNACQAMPSGGTLKILSRTTDTAVELVFADTGTGISAEVMQNIFEPLYSTKGFGIGLGLPIVKQIMERHQGEVMIESNSNAGTTVILRLPQKAH